MHHIRKILIATAAALGVLALAPPATATAAVPSQVGIAFAYYDSFGPDDGSNLSRNREYVRLYNYGSTGTWLTGWTIRDRSGNTYRFGTYFLSGHNYVTLHTGFGSNTFGHRYWGHSDYVWGNSFDTVYLTSPFNAGSWCGWSSHGLGYRYC